MCNKGYGLSPDILLILPVKQFITMFILSSLFKTASSKNAPIEKLNAADFHHAIQDEGVQLIDVRTPQEFSQGKIAHAVNLDFFDREALLAGLEKLDKSVPVYIYCRSGQRSGKAAGMMKRLGFSKVYDLRGGILDYNKQ